MLLQSKIVDNIVQFVVTATNCSAALHIAPHTHTSGSATSNESRDIALLNQYKAEYFEVYN